MIHEPDGDGVSMDVQPSPRTRHRVLVMRVLQLAAVVFLLAFAWTRRDELEAAFQASTSDVIALFALVVVGHAMNAFEFGLLYRASGIGIGHVENWAVFSAGQLGNYLPMQAGTIYRFRYLKVVHNLRYAANASNLAMNLVITLASTAVCGLVGVLGVAASGDRRISWIMLAIFGALLVFAIAAATLPMPSFLRPRPGHTGRFAIAWREFHRGWDELRRNPRVGVTVLVVDSLKLVLLAVRFQIAFELLGVDAPLWLFLVIGPVAALMGVIAFTPGALGLRELAVAGAAAAMGYSVPTGLLAATIDRGVMLCVTLALGGIGYAMTLPRLRKASSTTSVVRSERARSSGS